MMKRTPTPRSALVGLVTAIAVTAAACGVGDTTVAGPDTDGAVTPTPEVVAPPPTPEPSGGGPVDEQTPALNDARSRWANAAFDGYSYTVTMSCECSDEAFGPRRVHVRSGEVVSTKYFGLPTDVAGDTAEALFAMIEAAIAQGLQNEVSYDPLTGFPTVVRLDLEAIPADGGLDLTTTDFFSHDDVIADLEAARQAWADNGPASYTMAYREVCFCPEMLAEVTVTDGAITGATTVSDAGFDVTPRTVEDMFDEIQDALDRSAFRVSATFDPNTGAPLEYFIDDVEMMADEESGVTVESIVAA
jgi:hypothetical protein